MEAVVEAVVEKALVALKMLGTAVEGKLICAWPPGRPSTPPCQKPLERHSRHSRRGPSVGAHAQGRAPSIARPRMRCTARPARIADARRPATGSQQLPMEGAVGDEDGVDAMRKGWMIQRPGTRTTQARAPVPHPLYRCTFCHTATPVFVDPSHACWNRICYIHDV